MQRRRFLGLGLEIDPLLGLTTWLRTHALPGLLWLSLLTLGLSFVLGRAFCGGSAPSAR